MARTVSRVWNPAAYQGAGQTRRYFEGWYFKQVDVTGQRVLAVIPGVSFSADGTAKHAFVQVVAGGGTAHYFAYPIELFSYASQGPFSIRIGESTFSAAGMTLRLHDDVASVTGELAFGRWTPWPVTTLSPGIMGWYRFVPRMETYHGVLSMDHEVAGSLIVNGETVGFAGGRGYVEKDWGRSFPSSWIWAQSNSFGRQGVSVSVSVARVPWMTGAFVGNIAGLLVDGKLHRFATYTGARLACIETDENHARLVLRGRREQLELVIQGSDTLILKAPVLGAMEGRDAESLGGTIEVTLRELRGRTSRLVYSGMGRQAGVEIMNARNELGSKTCEGVLEGNGQV
ncbi:MAG: tocopherol cyclase family protein [Coriobacteriia bacterium]